MRTPQADEAKEGIRDLKRSLELVHSVWKHAEKRFLKYSTLLLYLYISYLEAPIPSLCLYSRFLVWWMWWRDIPIELNLYIRRDLQGTVRNHLHEVWYVVLEIFYNCCLCRLKIMVNERMWFHVNIYKSANYLIVNSYAVIVKKGKGKMKTVFCETLFRKLML